MRSITLVLFVCCTLVCSGTGFGQTVIWDQQPETSIPQVIDQEIPDQTTFSTYVVSDVTLAFGTMLSDVTVYFTNSSGTWVNNVDNARLCVFPDDLNSFDPSVDGQIVSVVVTDLGNNVLAVTARNVGITLDAGTYWIGLSPLAPTGISQEFHYASGNLSGELSFARNPGGGFGLGTDWFSVDMLSPSFMDAAITISVDGLGIPFIQPSSYSIVRGNLIAGTLSDLTASDNQRMEFQPGFVTNSNEAPIWLTFDGAVEPKLGAPEMEMESQAGTPGLTLTVEEYNWNTSLFETVGQESEAFNVDSVKILFSGRAPHNRRLNAHSSWLEKNWIHDQLSMGSPHRPVLLGSVHLS